MPSVVAYHRPASIDEALALLRKDGRLPLAGGTVVVPADHGGAVEVVDLQALGLEPISTHDDRIRLGAMARLQDLVDDPAVPDVLQLLARMEQPSTLRTLATVGGTVAAGGLDSVLVAGLLVHAATVELTADVQVTLPELLANPGVCRGRLILAVTAETGGVTAYAATGRTPADDPIVAAVARRDPQGSVRLALTGVASTPILVDPADPLAGLDPPGDFRGSSEYRRHLAATLAARVLEDVQS